VFLSYRHDQSTIRVNSYFYPANAVNNNNLFVLGVRFYFGTETLIAHDRGGPSLNDENPWYGARPVMREIQGSFDGVPVPV
jgi:hypothetical protein